MQKDRISARIGALALVTALSLVACADEDPVDTVPPPGVTTTIGIGTTAPAGGITTTTAAG